MTDRFTEFLQSLVADTYPEPPSPIHEEITAKVLPKVCKHLGECAHVLDVGCGQGVAFRHFARMFNRGTVVGITPNATDFMAAKEVADELTVQAEGEQAFFVRQLDMHHHWSEVDYFDLIWARHVLEHSPAPLFALREFSRVLKPGGWLYVEVPMPDTACHHETNKNHYSVLTDSMWQALIQKAGFTLVEGKVWRFVTGAGPDEYRSYLCRKSTE